MVVEAQSDTARIKALQQHISELEQLLGKKQFEIDFMKKQMEIASEDYGVDFKKNLLAEPRLVLETPKAAHLQNEPGLQIYRL